MFAGARLAVYVDGCFWHVCPLHSTIPKENREFWERKLLRNRARDLENTERLEAGGWLVLRVWEHEIEASPAVCADRISAIVGDARASKT